VVRNPPCAPPPRSPYPLPQVVEILEEILEPLRPSTMFADAFWKRTKNSCPAE